MDLGRKTKKMINFMKLAFCKRTTTQGGLQKVEAHVYKEFKMFFLQKKAWLL